MSETDKLKSKLKMMEQAFEIINNDRNHILEIKARLKDEIDNTIQLIREEDPFIMTRKDYLENLKIIWGNSPKLPNENEPIH